jgi:hypothetical protein
VYLVGKRMKPKASFSKFQEPTVELYSKDRWSHYIRLLSSFFKIRFNIIPYTPRSPNWSLPFRFSDPILHAVLPSRALHVSTPLNFFNFVAPVTLFEGWNVCSSSLHSFPLLRFWLWNIMQTSRKLCCVVRFFKSCGNCLEVHLRRFMSNVVRSEQLGVKRARKQVRWRVPQCREQLSLEMHVTKTTWILIHSSCAWQAHSRVSAVVHGRHTQGSLQLCMAGTLKDLCSCAWQAHSRVSAVVHGRHTQGSLQLCMAGTLKVLCSCAWQAHSRVSVVVHDRHT